MTAASSDDGADGITTLIFDVDDTLYDVGCGFCDHRNFEAAPRFMMERLGFTNLEAAKKIRDEYFNRYHSTTKALLVAEEEGMFPPDPDGAFKAPRFHPSDYDEYLSSDLNYELLGGKKSKLLEDLKVCKLKMVAFSNAPRKYVTRVLLELGLWEIFGEERLFAVGDVLPACKPQKEAFDKVFKAVDSRAEQCVLIEDSMKNIRCAKALGLKTVLVAGSGCLHNNSRGCDAKETKAIERYDAPIDDDPAVDVTIETVDDLRLAVPGLWATPAVFVPNR